MILGIKAKVVVVVVVVILVVVVEVVKTALVTTATTTIAAEGSSGSSSNSRRAMQSVLTIAVTLSFVFYLNHNCIQCECVFSIYIYHHYYHPPSAISLTNLREIRFFILFHNSTMTMYRLGNSALFYLLQDAYRLGNISQPSLKNVSKKKIRKKKKKKLTGPVRTNNLLT